MEKRVWDEWAATVVLFDIDDLAIKLRFKVSTALLTTSL